MIAESACPPSSLSEPLFLSKKIEFSLNNSFKGKALVLSRPQNNKTLKIKHNLGFKNLKLKISPLRTDLKFKKLSVLKTLFSCIERELEEVNCFRENKLSEQKFFSKKKQIVKFLIHSKQTILFKFLIVNNSNSTKIPLEKKNYFSRRFDLTGQFSASQKNLKPKYKPPSSVLNGIKKINFLSYPVPNIPQRATLSQDLNFPSNLGINSEKKIIKKVEQDTWALQNQHCAQNLWAPGETLRPFACGPTAIPRALHHESSGPAAMR